MAIMRTSRNRKLRGFVGVIAALALAWPLALTSGPVKASGPSTDNVRISHEPPTVAEHRAVYERVRNDPTLAAARAFFAAFRLPRPISFVTRSCASRWNGAWYFDGAVTVCYEYLKNALDNAAADKRPDWVSQEGAISGQIADVFIHEGAHALFEFLRTPLMGREEDAADQFATFVILNLFGDDAPAMVRGIAYSYLVDAQARTFSDLPSLQQRTLPARAYGGAHSTPLQRMFSIVCHASGFDEAAYRDLVQMSELPRWRAGGCEDEYGQIAHAFRALLAPHLDKERLRAHFPKSPLLAND
jgi:hypothetical protein